MTTSPNKTMKTVAAAAVTFGLILGSAAVPTSADAYTRYVCKYEQKKREKTGTIIGAVAGAVIGSQLSKEHRGVGAVGGAVVGGAIGSKMGHDSGKKACTAANAYRTKTVYSRDSKGRQVKTVYRYVQG
jgi:uncharacterized protein YcfJ